MGELKRLLTEQHLQTDQTAHKAVKVDGTLLVRPARDDHL